MPRTECEKHKSKPKGPSGRWSVTSAFIKVPLLLSTLSPLVFKYLGSPNELWWEWCVWLLTRQEKGIVFFYFWRLSFITNREIRDERLVPSFDIVARIRARRLIWAGHLLREKEEHLPKRVAVARLKSDLQEHSSLRTTYGLSQDAPDLNTFGELEDKAQSRRFWRSLVVAIEPEDTLELQKGRMRGKQGAREPQIGSWRFSMVERSNETGEVWWRTDSKITKREIPLLKPRLHYIHITNEYKH